MTESQIADAISLFETEQRPLEEVAALTGVPVSDVLFCLAGLNLAAHPPVLWDAKLAGDLQSRGLGLGDLSRIFRVEAEVLALRLTVCREKLSGDQILECVVLYGQGEPIDCLMSRFQVSAATVVAYLLENRVRLRERLAWRLEFAIQLYSRGVGRTLISRCMRVAVTSVTRKLRRAHVAISGTGARADRCSVPPEVVCREYVDGMTPGAIARKHSISRSTVSRYLRIRGIPLRRNRKYSVDESVFDDPLKPEAAYYIGLLMADGNVCQPRRGQMKLTLMLQARDLTVVEGLRAFLRSDHPITYRPPAKPTQQWQRCIVVISDRLCRKLIEWGVTVKKSHTARVHDALAMNPHFYRGLLDGDGSVKVYRYAHRKYESSHIKFVSASRALAEQYATFVESVIGHPVHVGKRAGRDFFYITTTAHDSQALVRAVYQNQSPAMARKLEVANEILAIDMAGRKRRCHLSKERLQELLLEHKTWKKVSEVTGVHYGTLQSALRRFGLNMSLKELQAEWRSRLDPVMLQQLYEAHGSWTKVAESLGLTGQHLRYHMVRLGILPPETTRAAIRAKWDAICSDPSLQTLLAELGNWKRVAEHLGVDYGEFMRAMWKRKLIGRDTAKKERLAAIWAELTPQRFQELLAEEGQVTKVAARLGVNISSLWDRIRRYNLNSSI